MLSKALFLSLLSLGVAFGGPPLKDALNVSPGIDTFGQTPTIPGNAPNQYVYAISVAPNTAVADTIPVTFSVTNTNNTTPQSYNDSLVVNGPLAPFISFTNASFSINDDGSTTVDNIYLNTTNLAAGDYHTNVHVSSQANGLTIAHDIIHLHIHVAAVNAPSCFVTDSAGLLLYACDGVTPVSSGGEFIVVYNGKKVTATNPGQFYYNLEWTNSTGVDQTLSFSLDAVNVLPQGANSVHYLVYNQTQFSQNVFDNVNTNGTPCGPLGSTCTSISVPSGQTLWLTWHVAYKFLGKPLPPGIPLLSDCATSVNGTISMSATVNGSDANNPVSFQCVGTANGYRLY